MNKSSAYTESFYLDRNHLTRSSADMVVESVWELLQPASVVDLGCGVGTWLAAFGRRGCQKILGMDGPYVNVDLLEIPADCFKSSDLSLPIELGERFDLAISLEVAEHLDAKYARRFVQSLTGLAPVVLFSAAIPYQGGVHHVNEQWPEYWNSLFEEEGFVCLDCLRTRLWDRKDILYWYRQNILLFVDKNYLANDPSLSRAHGVFGGVPRSIVHPEAYLSKCNSSPSVYSAAVGLAGLIKRKLFSRISIAK